MDLVGWLPEGLDDRLAAGRARNQGLDVWELSALSIEPPRRGALLLGYAAQDEEEIREGVRRLALALRCCAI